MTRMKKLSPSSFDETTPLDIASGSSQTFSLSTVVKVNVNSIVYNMKYLLIMGGNTCTPDLAIFGSSSSCMLT